MSTPPKRRTIRAKASATSTALVTSQAKRRAAELLRHRLGGGEVAVEHGDLGALRRERRGGRRADARAAAGDDDDLAREPLLGLLAELGLLERPVLDVEEIVLAERLVACRSPRRR